MSVYSSRPDAPVSMDAPPYSPARPPHTTTSFATPPHDNAADVVPRNSHTTNSPTHSPFFAVPSLDLGSSRPESLDHMPLLKPFHSESNSWRIAGATGDRSDPDSSHVFNPAGRSSYSELEDLKAAQERKQVGFAFHRLANPNAQQLRPLLVCEYPEKCKKSCEHPLLSTVSRAPGLVSPSHTSSVNPSKYRETSLSLQNNSNIRLQHSRNQAPLFAFKSIL